MQAAIESRPSMAVLLLKAFHTLWQLRKWEREARRATQLYEIERTETALKRVNTLNNQCDELICLIRKRETR